MSEYLARQRMSAAEAVKTKKSLVPPLPREHFGNWRAQESRPGHYTPDDLFDPPTEVKPSVQMLATGMALLTSIILVGTGLWLELQNSHYIPVAMCALGITAFIASLRLFSAAHREVMEPLLLGRRHIRYPVDPHDRQILTRSGALTFSCGKSGLMVFGPEIQMLINRSSYEKQFALDETGSFIAHCIVFLKSKKLESDEPPLPVGRDYIVIPQSFFPKETGPGCYMTFDAFCALL